MLFLFMIPLPPRSTLFPYTTLFRSLLHAIPTCAARRKPLAHPPPRTSLVRSEEHTSELQSLTNIVCRLLLEKKKENHYHQHLVTAPAAERGRTGKKQQTNNNQTERE